MSKSDTMRIAAIERGLADVLASNVVPRDSVAAAAGVVTTAVKGPPAERAVVWASAARDVYLETISTLAATDPLGAIVTATLIDRVAQGLGHDASGTAGRVATTYEKAVPDTAFVLVYEIVCWTKAGEVIALVHVISETT